MTAVAILFWVAVWELLSILVGSRWLLPSPLSVIKCLAGLSVTPEFWKTIGVSAIRIAGGFFGALAVGNLLAVLSYIWTPVKVVTEPFLRLIKAVPVASFVILVLLWVRSAGLPFVISFLMVLPVVYVNVLAGAEAADVKLLEMAAVFEMDLKRRLKYIYIPAVKPYFVSACSLGLGFCWKSGVAAEVIALAPNSIGLKLYEAKLYLTTDELFAWTVVIILISLMFERAVMALIRRLTA